VPVGRPPRPAVVEAAVAPGPVLPAAESATPAGSPLPFTAGRRAGADDPAGARPEGTVYRARRRPGLTTPGVAVLCTAVGLVFGLISTVLTGGLGWLFGLPLALISGYCAWEVRESDRRAPVLAPPLTLLVVAVVASLVGDGWLGLTGLAVAVLATLVAAAPMLVLAEVIVGGVLIARYVRRRRGSTA
jgi:hypothetical protein